MAEPNAIQAGKCRCGDAMTARSAEQSWLACRPPRHPPSLWPVSGLTKAPLHLPARVMLFLAQWLPACTTLRACIEAGSASRPRCVRSPLRGQHRWTAPASFAETGSCFPFNCARRNARASTRLGASVSAVSSSVKAPVEAPVEDARRCAIPARAPPLAGLPAADPRSIRQAVRSSHDSCAGDRA